MNAEELPKGWAMATIGDLCAPIEKTDPQKWVRDTSFTYFDISSIDSNHHQVREGREIPASAAPSRARQMVQPGDVLFSTVRTYLENIARVPAKAGDLPLLASTGFCVLRPVGGVDPRFLFYRCMAPDLLAAMEAHQQGTSYPAIRDQDLFSFKIAVPPRAEQVRIADELERRLSHVDAANRALEVALHKLTQVSTALIDRAVTGRLVACSLDRLDASLLEVAAKGATGMTTRLPSDWRWVRLAHLLREPMRNGRSAQTAAAGSGVRTFTITAVTKRDFGLHHTKWAVGDADRLKDVYVKTGDLFVQRSNTPELVGSAALYRGPDDVAVFPDLLIRLRTVPAVRPEWLDLVLRWQRSRTYLRSVAVGLAGSMPKIDQAKIGSLLVPVPPTRSQDEVLQDLSRRLSLVEAAEASVFANLRKAQRLQASLFAEAFSGRLVPQDAGDEPATVLLERIRASRKSEPARRPRQARKEKVS